MARRLASDGFAVAVNYRSDHDGAGKVVAEITEAGGRAAAFAADVTDPAGVDRLIGAVERELGPVAALVCNATGPQPDTPVSDPDWPDYLAHLEFFVKSPVLLQRRAAGDEGRGGAGSSTSEPSRNGRRRPGWPGPRPRGWSRGRSP
ncbi:hypothetical protein GCM10017786_52200 [Amycolatopsis deserti]|uniref:Uncharacterized protein n=1 Tax=Amycolatopsis deserti TaxID=185696 RepID=A0ABQ3JD31_9PSEU|nr:hypothetical protein GCM10017786_52200 [Amycolatopsis deserti]